MRLVATGFLLTVGALGVLSSAGIRAQSSPAVVLPKVAIDGVQLLQDLKTLSADDMQGRQAGTEAGARARAYVVARFKASGIQPFGQSYTMPFPLGGQQDGTGVNVVGRVAGRRQPARHVVVSAHYDHVGVQDGRVFNGANDNASGTAALFALAKYFSANPPQHTLIFAAFDAEEMNLTGARAFVRQPPVDRTSIALDINADMIGRDEHNTLYVSGTFEQPFLKPFVARVGGRAPVTLLMGYDNPKAGAAYWMRMSDQWAFLEAGIPALYVGVEDYEHLHKPSDDYDNMTHAFYVNAVETLRMLIEEFDKGL
jgi:Zn-dependent M28 family amino/carboxypeptidase